uniref:Variant surface glycoprotein 818 n=1 Tax=Trypanosoma brucei TaxID=5691 RepID=M4T0S8_9TRYP|nr:variant surface glycoprotein 818 [Trypanosoma brucei]
MLVSAVLFLFLLSTTEQASAVGDDDAKNLAELDALCDIVNLRQAKDTGLPAVQSVEATYEIIEALNMSLAHPDWAKQFPTKPPTGTDQEDPCKDNNELPQCHKQWQAHAKANIKAHSDAIRPGNKYIDDAKKRSAEGQAAALTLAAITAHAQHLAETHATDMKPAIDGAKARIDAYINKAVFGQDPAGKTAGARCKTPTGSTRQDICKDNNVGDSICTTLACVCSKSGDTMTADICSASTTQEVNPDTTPANYATAGSTLIAMCEKHGRPELTASAIRTAAGRPRQLWKTFATGGAIAVYLGTKGTAANCGKQANCACAEFSKFAKHKTTKVATATGYETNLEAAAQELEKTLAAGEQQKRVIAEMSTLKRKAETVFSHLLSTVPAQSRTGAKSTSTTGTGTPNQGCDKHTNKTVEECKTLDCDHDSKTKKCKAKAGTESTEGKGETPNAEGKKCSDKKNEAVCKDGCKWEGRECKDSSFIVSKKSALSMVAEFLSLVVFQHSKGFFSIS